MNKNYIVEARMHWDRVPEDSYVRSIPSLKGLESLEFTKPVTFFVGDNGSGKSTLLEAIAVAFGFNAEGGTLNYNFSTCDDVSALHEGVQIIRSYRRPNRGIFLRAESFFNVATRADEYAGRRSALYGDKKLHDQSHGESFMSFIEAFDDGMYMMDEPEAALSQRRQMELLSWMLETTKMGAQYIVATHSPILLAFPDADIVSFGEDGLSHIGYEDTDSYQLTKLFIDNKDSILERLMAE